MSLDYLLADLTSPWNCKGAYQVTSVRHVLHRQMLVCLYLTWVLQGLIPLPSTSSVWHVLLKLLRILMVLVAKVLPITPQLEIATEVLMNRAYILLFAKVYVQSTYLTPLTILHLYFHVLIHFGDLL